MRSYHCVSFQGGSLSQLFVSFLETESAPALSTSLPSYSRLDPPPAGRVDPSTDPDRLSRATAASIAHHPTPNSSIHVHPPSGLPHPSTRPSVSSDSPILIHSNIDSQSHPNTGTTPGLHLNIAVPASEVATNPIGSHSSRPSAPMLSPIPPTLTTAISSQSVSPQSRSFHDSPAAAASSAIRPSATPQNRRTLPAQSRPQSYQSSILKNLLSTD